MTKLHQVADLGQAIWLDYIRRSFTRSGGLQALVDQGLRGVTSNPSIFEKAIAGSDDYDDQTKMLVKTGLDSEGIYEALALTDIGEAADVLISVHNRTEGLDGYVSLEVDPNLAHDTERTVSEGIRLFAVLGRPNVFIKVPATAAGIPAIAQLIGEGINVNVTLIFGQDHYRAVAEAYIEGLETLLAKGGDVSRVASVASLFISRTDAAVDKKLSEIGNDSLQGKIALANTKVVYSIFEELFAGERWERLAAAGARVQRPLWASTSTKNPAYPDTLYVDNLIGPSTVNTLPLATVEAFMDHGAVAETVQAGVDDARADLQALAALGIDLDEITQGLQDAGVEAFSKAFASLMAAVGAKRERML